VLAGLAPSRKIVRSLLRTPWLVKLAGKNDMNTAPITNFYFLANISSILKIQLETQAICLIFCEINFS
jgi:hypothetical protein